MNVFDVAKYILLKTGRISTWKLQKLCYYSQAWSLAWTEKPLFDEEFEAWENGPVCRELFNVHRGKFMVESDDIVGNADALDLDQAETVDIIVRDYGDKQPFELREMTHMEAPWKDARGTLPPDAPCSTIISKTAMGSYYGAL